MYRQIAINHPINIKFEHTYALGNARFQDTFPGVPLNTSCSRMSGRPRKNIEFLGLFFVLEEVLAKR